MRKLKRIYGFITQNGEKILTIRVYFLTAYYRWCVLHLPSEQLEKKMGVRGEESSDRDTMDHYKEAKLIAFHVNRITQHTPWESQCLIRALTIRRLLLERDIICTIYLGVMKEDEKMKAHAWVRCGETYPTGGTGAGFVVVAKFRSR